MAQDRQTYETKKAAYISRLALLEADEKRIAEKKATAKAGVEECDRKLAEIAAREKAEQEKAAEAAE